MDGAEAGRPTLQPLHGQARTGDGAGRIAVVGCGHWGRNLARNFAGLRALGAVVDVDPAAAERVASANGVTARSFEEVLGDPDVAAVAIATPAESHRDVTLRALDAGKHVFVEKPIALSLEDGRVMGARARAAGRVLMVGHLLRYHAAFRRLRSLLAAGAVGELLYLYSNRLSMGRLRTEEDVLWSFAPHDVSMILDLAGERPETVSAHGASLVSRATALCDEAHVHLGFASGLRAHVHVSWLSPFKEQRLVVVGSEGSLTFDDTLPWSHKLVHTPHAVGEGALAKGEPAAVDLVESEPLRAECEHFLGAIAGRHAPLTDADEALGVLDVLVRASESFDGSIRMPPPFVRVAGE